MFDVFNDSESRQLNGVMCDSCLDFRHVYLFFPPLFVVLLVLQWLYSCRAWGLGRLNNRSSSDAAVPEIRQDVSVRISVGVGVVL